MSKKIRKDFLIPHQLFLRISKYQEKTGLNFTSAIISLLNEVLELKKI